MKRRLSPKQKRHQLRRRKRIELEELIKDNAKIYRVIMPGVKYV